MWSGSARVDVRRQIIDALLPSPHGVLRSKCPVCFAMIGLKYSESVFTVCSDIYKASPTTPPKVSSDVPLIFVSTAACLTQESIDTVLRSSHRAVVRIVQEKSRLNSLGSGSALYLRLGDQHCRHDCTRRCCCEPDGRLQLQCAII